MEKMDNGIRKEAKGNIMHSKAKKDHLEREWVK